jgi:hypothetical protein
VKGHRKVFVFVVTVAALLGGLVLAKDGAYPVFAAAIVGAGGWFFKANVDVHKAGGEK